MAQLAQLAYAEAYQIKAEMGGGFRGVALNSLTQEQFRGDVRSTLDDARNDAKRAVWAWADGRGMVTGTYRNKPGKNWRMNFFIRSDEVASNERKAA